MRLCSSACGILCGGPSPARGCRGLQQVTAGLLGWRSFPGDVCQRLQAVWTAPAGQGVLSAPAGEARGVAPHPAMRRTPQHGGRLPPRDHSVEVGESWVSLERCSSRGAPSVAAGMHLQTRATDGGNPGLGWSVPPHLDCSLAGCFPAGPARQRGGSRLLCPRLACSHPPCPATN